MAKGKLKIATCQFAVSSSIPRNLRSIIAQMRRAKKARADIVHFPECALTGYAGVDMDDLSNLDWELLKESTRQIMALAAKLRLWVVLGSAHRLTGANKPHNCLYLIGPDGRIANRYDKRFCMTIDLENYTPGSRFVYFTVNGVKCSLLICFDLRFPEIYRELHKKGVQCVFQSFYNARQKGPSVHSQIMRQSMQCRAATNFFWVSMSNASGYYSPYPSCFIEPNGRIAAQLKTNRAGIMTNTVDTGKEFYDPMAPFRKMAIKGKLNNNQKKINDPRSKNTRRL